MLLLSIKEKVLLASLVRPHPVLYCHDPIIKNTPLKNQVFDAVGTKFCELTHRDASEENVKLVQDAWNDLCEQFYLNGAKKTKGIIEFDIARHCSFIAEQKSPTDRSLNNLLGDLSRSSSTDSSATNYSNDEQSTFERSKSVFIGNTKNIASGDKEKPFHRRHCCACGFTSDRSHFIHLTTVPQKRAVWLTALGLSQEEQNLIETKLTVHPNALLICKSHFPRDSFRCGRPLPHVLPVKMDSNRTPMALKEKSTEISGNCISPMVRPVSKWFGGSRKTDSDQKYECTIETQVYSSSQPTSLKRTIDDVMCSQRQDEVEAVDVAPLKRARSHSPPRQISCLSMQPVSDSWCSVVPAHQQSSDNMASQEVTANQMLGFSLKSDNTAYEKQFVQPTRSVSDLFEDMPRVADHLDPSLTVNYNWRGGGDKNPPELGSLLSLGSPTASFSSLMGSLTPSPTPTQAMSYQIPTLNYSDSSMSTQEADHYTTYGILMGQLLKGLNDPVKAYVIMTRMMNILTGPE